MTVVAPFPDSANAICNVTDERTKAVTRSLTDISLKSYRVQGWEEKVGAAATGGGEFEAHEHTSLVMMSSSITMPQRVQTELPRAWSVSMFEPPQPLHFGM